MSRFVSVQFSSPRGVSTIRARLAQSPAELTSGFANRTDIGFEEAILFDVPSPVPFTMAQTLVPLDILFLGPPDSNGLSGVVQISRGNPLDPNPISAPPYRFALETAAGRLAAHQIGYDSTVRIAEPSLKKKRN